MPFNPGSLYPTEAAQLYVAQFVAGAESQQLSGIPEALLNRLIDAGIGHNWGAEEAGRVMGRLYHKLRRRPEYARRGVIDTDDLLREFVKELERLQVLR